MAKNLTANDLGEDVLKFICDKLRIPMGGLIALNIQIEATKPIEISAKYYVKGPDGGLEVVNDEFRTIVERFNVVRADD